MSQSYGSGSGSSSEKGSGSIKGPAPVKNSAQSNVRKSNFEGNHNKIRRSTQGYRPTVGFDKIIRVVNRQQQQQQQTAAPPCYPPPPFPPYFFPPPLPPGCGPPFNLHPPMPFIRPNFLPRNPIQKQNCCPIAGIVKQTLKDDSPPNESPYFNNCNFYITDPNNSPMMPRGFSCLPPQFPNPKNACRPSPPLVAPPPPKEISIQEPPPPPPCSKCLNYSRLHTKTHRIRDKDHFTPCSISEPCSNSLSSNESARDWQRHQSKIQRKDRKYCNRRYEKRKNTWISKSGREISKICSPVSDDCRMSRLRTPPSSFLEDYKSSSSSIKAIKKTKNGNYKRSKECCSESQKDFCCCKECIEKFIEEQVAKRLRDHSPNSSLGSKKNNESKYYGDLKNGTKIIVDQPIKSVSSVSRLITKSAKSEIHEINADVRITQFPNSCIEESGKCFCKQNQLGTTNEHSDFKSSYPIKHSSSHSIITIYFPSQKNENLSNSDIEIKLNQENLKREIINTINFAAPVETIKVNSSRNPTSRTVLSVHDDINPRNYPNIPSSTILHEFIPQRNLTYDIITQQNPTYDVFVQENPTFENIPQRNLTYDIISQQNPTYDDITENNRYNLQSKNSILSNSQTETFGNATADIVALKSPNLNIHTNEPKFLKIPKSKIQDSTNTPKILFIKKTNPSKISNINASLPASSKVSSAQLASSMPKLMKVPTLPMLQNFGVPPRLNLDTRVVKSESNIPQNPLNNNLACRDACKSYSKVRRIVIQKHSDEYIRQRHITVFKQHISCTAPIENPQPINGLPVSIQNPQLLSIFPSSSSTNRNGTKRRLPGYRE